MTAFPFSSTTAKPARLIVVALALLLGLILLLAGPAQPAAASCGGVTIVGNETQLNAAIAAYNAVGTSPCVFTIQFSGDIPLTASTTTINNATAGVELVIEGAGFAVDGQGTDGVRPFDIAANTTVTMNQITVTGGHLTVAVDAGGGIRNRGVLTITNSSINDNESLLFGGGIANETGGALTIRNSTVSGNRTIAQGGGIINYEVLTLDSVTMTGNQTGGGGALFITGSSAVATIRNSILANTTGGTTNDCETISGGTVTDGGHNLVEAQNGCGFVDGVNGNIVGQDPVLGALQNNGGPTPTTALLPGSPAIDGGDTTLTTDQRGIARPQGAADDIGAFESRGFSLAYSAGSPQSTLINSPFTDPLVVMVSSAFAEPVDGGQVIFTAPGSGASLATTPLMATISSGSASQAVSANGIGGSYTVSADTRGNVGSPVSFDLQNQLIQDCSLNSWTAGSELELNAAIDCYNGKATAGPYTITLTQNINLTASTTQINNATSGVSLVLDGAGFTVHGQGTAGVRPFSVGGGDVVAMNNLTVTGGNMPSGGGIYNIGFLTLNNSTVTGNHAFDNGAGISNDGTLTLNNSTVSNNNAAKYGGGVANSSSLTVNTSTFSGNQVVGTGSQYEGFGGAIDNLGTLVITNSDFVGNRAPSGGGAVSSGKVNQPGVTATIEGTTFRDNVGHDGGTLGSGGAVELSSGTTTIKNSTFSGNQALGSADDGGGAIALSFDSQLTLLNSTLSGNSSAANGGGISRVNNGTATIENTIVAGNTGSGGASDLSGGGLTSSGHNLFGTLTGTSLTAQASDIVGQSPLLAPLGNYGGATRTMALLPGSPAIDAGDTTLATDQRGIARPQGAADDIGAFESRGFSLAYSAGSPQSTPINTAFPNPLVVTVSSAFAEPVDGGQVIFTAPGSGASLATTPLTAAISSGSASQAVSANGTAGSYAVSADTRGNLGSPVSFDLQNQLIQDCSLNSWTAGSELELNEAILCYNGKTAAGTYTINITQDIDLTASTPVVTNNSAGVSLVIAGGGFTVDGQGISGVKPFNIQGGPVTINNLTITGGNSTAGAGGIYNLRTLTLNNCTVTGNSAATVGGGIRNIGNLRLNNSTISGNTAGTGGGIYVEGGSASLDSVTVADNIATTGGGIAQVAGTVTLANTIVGNNSASGSGPDLSGTITSADHNLVEDTSGATFTPQAHDITGVDPLLGALADNGGPTETHALLPGSPAINAGDTPLTTDQRGVTRPQGAADDIGAFEASCPAFPADVASEAELNFAIACYNAETTAGTYTINITQDIDLTASTTAIDNATSGVELVVEGGSNTVDAQGVLDARAFFVKADTKVTIRQITVTGGNTTGPSNSGAVISVVRGTLTLIDSTLTGNQGSFGGALSNTTGTVTIENSTLSNNNASGGFLPLGGAIFNAGSDVGGVTTVGTVNVINSTISGNQTSGRGGGIYNSPDGVLNVTNSTISDNQATLGGGGIVNSTDSTVTLNNTIVANSTGGDCVRDAGTINAQNSLIEDGLTCVNGTNSNNLTGDPNLGVLQNNGGPTETHALLSGSIAIDAGDNALAVDPDNNPLTTDQRGAGYPRIVGGTVDMGAYEKDTPQAVTLASFEAAAQADHVLVTWQTVSELENAGFNLYRTTAANPPAAADLLVYVPSQGPGSTQGFAYSHQDYAVTAGQTYWYWLEAVDFNGATTLHGPVSVVFVAPTAVTLSGLAASSPAPLAWPWWLAAIATALAAAAAVVWRRRTTS